jgi:collagenase-like PrtC family protease
LKLSVAYSFQKNLIPELGRYPEVTEIFGKLLNDNIGGGRSSLTFQPVSKRNLIDSVNEAHKFKIKFNYLLNGSTLNGLEQTRSGQKKIHNQLEFLSKNCIDGVTVASPYLLRLIKKQYPCFETKISAFAAIDHPEKAKQWFDMGADVLCISAISCNRDFKKLEAIRNAVKCELQLIVNSTCLSNCSYELTHMNMLTNSSRAGDMNKGFCFDYCLIHCMGKRLSSPTKYIKSIWIRPEDLKQYEDIGYDSFKILERSSPAGLLLKRVKAYAERSFDGNLLELVAPIALIKKEQKAGFFHRMHMFYKMIKPGKIKISSLVSYKKFMEGMIIDDFSLDKSPIYIDNKHLNDFLSDFRKIGCSEIMDCKGCGFCDEVASRHVMVNAEYEKQMLDLYYGLDKGLVSSTHWL